MFSSPNYITQSAQFQVQLTLKWCAAKVVCFVKTGKFQTSRYTASSPSEALGNVCWTEQTNSLDGYNSFTARKFLPHVHSWINPTALIAKNALTYWYLCLVGHPIPQPYLYDLQHTDLLKVLSFCTLAYLSTSYISHSISSYLLVFLHSGIQLLGEVIGHIGHARLLLIATTQTALVLTCLLVVLLFGIFAVSLAHLAILKAFYVMYLSYTTSTFYYFHTSYNCRTKTHSNSLQRHLPWCPLKGS